VKHNQLPYQIRDTSPRSTHTKHSINPKRQTFRNTKQEYRKQNLIP